MNSDKFIKLMRTIIAEEVRRVVREELRLSLNEQRESKADYSNSESYTPGSMKSKYAFLMEEDKPQKPQRGQSNGPASMQDLLAETAATMRHDPNSKQFFEGLM